MVAVLCAVIGAMMPSPAIARALCTRGVTGPTTTVDLYDGRGRVVATMTATPCRPNWSEITVTSKGGRPGLAEDFVLLHRGTCERPKTWPLDRDEWNVSAKRLSQSSFVVELTRAGEPAPYACGFHKGKLPLPPSAAALPPAKWSRFVDIRKMKRVAHGYVVKGLESGRVLSLGRFDSIDGGRRTRFNWLEDLNGSSGTHARLRPGTCRRIDAGHEIVLDPEVDTVIQVPLAELVQRPYALEFMGSSAAPPGLDSCFDF